MNQVPPDNLVWPSQVPTPHLRLYSNHGFVSYGGKKKIEVKKLPSFFGFHFPYYYCFNHKFLYKSMIYSRPYSSSQPLLWLLYLIIVKLTAVILMFPQLWNCKKLKNESVPYSVYYFCLLEQRYRTEVLLEIVNVIYSCDLQHLIWLSVLVKHF